MRNEASERFIKRYKFEKKGGRESMKWIKRLNYCPTVYRLFLEISTIEGRKNERYPFISMLTLTYIELGKSTRKVEKKVGINYRTIHNCLIYFINEIEFAKTFNLQLSEQRMKKAMKNKLQ